MTTRWLRVALVSALTVVPSLQTVQAQSANASCPAARAGALPLTYAGPPTSAPISACDLMTRLYQFADDSMGGRRIGTSDHERATAYLAAEAKRLGLEPAGEGGTYFQNLPLFSRALDTTSTLFVSGTTLKAGVDFLANTTAARPAEFSGWQIVYGGSLLDTTTAPFSVPPSGVIVFFRSIAPGADGAAIQRTAKGRAWVAWYNAIRNRASATAGPLAANLVRNATNPTAMTLLADQGAAITLTFSATAAQTLFGGSFDGVAAGSPTKPIALTLRYVDTPRINRNVVAKLPGADTKLRGQYVALGAHADHLGTFRAAVDHDSVRAAHMGARSGTEGAASRKQTTEDEEYDRIKFLTDSLHKARPIRRDSIYNGADDGGSGAVALLEIAEAFSRGTAKPKRSVLFVWHTGTESVPALSGSSWYLDHPTVPRDSITAQFTVDMIGRGVSPDRTRTFAGSNTTV